MQSINFEILRKERPALAVLGGFAEHYLHTDPPSCLTKLRIYGEQLTKAIYWELRLKRPEELNFDGLLSAPEFKQAVPKVILDKLHALRKEGNKAAHGQAVDGKRASWVLEEAFQLGAWFLVRFLGRKPEDIPAFHPIEIPTAKAVETEATKAALEEKERQLLALVAERDALKQAYQALEVKADTLDKGQQAADALKFNEATTRRRLIDVALADAGWNVGANGKNTAEVGQEVELPDQPTNSGIGYADYVLWDDDGKPLAVIEAKKTTVSAETGRKQAELYANALEKLHGLRPAIFYTNGFDIWLWDDAQGYAPRSLFGFYSKDSLQHLVRFKRSSKEALNTLTVNPSIAGRMYQIETIKRVTEAFSKKKTKALIVQATGTGKTRVAIALSDLLIRAKWVKRVLFLCDRNELRRQAKNAYTEHLPEPLAVVNSATSKDRNKRIYVATYPSMMGVFQSFDAGFFDLIIADESHRSIYNVYGDIFRYFDALQVGLTATPVEFISRNTFSLFGCQGKDPTAAYTLERAIQEGFLVPYEVYSHTTQFLRDGIKYDELSEEQKQEVEEEGIDPGELDHEAEDVSKQIFNKDTERQILRNLMENGIRDATGQSPGKSVIFARSHDHAVLLEKLFNEMYPQYGGRFCQVIDNYNPRAESLIDDFKGEGTNDELTIAISVDMLDTGIDVPEIVNLVFAKPVKSKVKFWQMIGRGTRLCPGLFGPGKDKTVFRIFDHWGNFEYFAQDKPEAEPTASKPLMQRLFEARLALASAALSDMELDTFTTAVKLVEADVRALPDDSISVKEKRQDIHAILQDGVIEQFSPATQQALKGMAAPLMQWVNVRGHSDALDFDLLVTTMQAALIKKSAEFQNLKGDMVNRVNALQMNLNQVKAKAESIKKVKSADFWATVTPAQLEALRQDLRGIMQFRQGGGTGPGAKPRVIDITEDEGQIETGKTSSNIRSVDLAAYRARVEQALAELFATDPTLKKIRAGEQVTQADLEALVSLVLTRHPDVDLTILKDFYPETAGHLDLIIRQIVGMDPDAVKAHFTAFVQTYPSLTAAQTQFLQLLQNHIAQNGAIALERLADSPFTMLDEEGIFGVFPSDTQRNDLLAIIKSFLPEETVSP
ncbi:DEAD/DEAH box helicase family protein [Phaeospirillum tilakii]|uniref:DEAD/DEAH box helicase family protein n=1 Tax=Phaeospirillum tilakii TaxID=741673 RepID=A0ABW5CF17_9PROT